MGTFHSDKGPLHGLTVVVRTDGPLVYVGRCNTETPDGIHLWDVDRHEDGQDGLSTEAWLKRVAMVGHWPREKNVHLARAEYVSVEKLV